MTRAARRRKQRNRRILMTVALMMLVVLVSVGGTIAWLTAKTKPVTNTFTVGNIGLSLAETKNDFKMVPGIEIEKDPKVTVSAGSEACWVFVKIEESSTLDTYINYSVDSAWTALDGNPGVYYIQQSATIANGEAGEDGVNADTAVVYSVLTGDKVTVPSTVTKSQMDALEATGATQPTLTFTAYAIQQSGFDTAAKAWAEIQNTTNWNESGANTPATAGE